MVGRDDKPMEARTKAKTRIASGRRSASAADDVVLPTSETDLTQALEDSFPASDPINLAGSIAGSPVASSDPTPVGPHPMSGSDDPNESSETS